MERYKCKFCFKSFCNGRSLGGHMRSHVMNLSGEGPSNQLFVTSEEIDSASSSSSSSEEEEGEDKSLFYELRDNPKKSVRLVDPEFAFPVDAGSVVLQDRESETESSKNPTRRRSKRIRRYSVMQRQEDLKKFRIDKSFSKAAATESSSWPPAAIEHESASSISDVTTEEDVAYCLMMLSRDRKRIGGKNLKNEHEEHDEERSVTELETDDSDQELANKIKARGSSGSRAKYKCETCKKVFKSYQALGGHRASHKKMKSYINPNLNIEETQWRNVGTEGGSSSMKNGQKIHECPVCYRVFSSGQALGGHKRSHVSGIGIGIGIGMAQNQYPPLPPHRNLTKSSSISAEKLIDLNLPAPMEEDEISQIELSAISDAPHENHE